MRERHRRTALLLALLHCVVFASGEDSSVQIHLQSNSVTELASTLLADFVKLVVTANSNRLGPTTTCAGSAQVCAVSASANDAIVSAVFSSPAYASKFAEIMVS